MSDSEVLRARIQQLAQQATQDRGVRTFVAEDGTESSDSSNEPSGRVAPLVLHAVGVLPWDRKVDESPVGPSTSDFARLAISPRDRASNLADPIAPRLHTMPSVDLPR